MRLFLIVVALLAVSGCQIIYKLPTRQGNVLMQKDLDKLKLGMTREQVRFVLGTPVSASPFRPDRWDYISYYRSPRGEVSERTVSLFFEGQQLARMDGLQSAAGEAQSDPDMQRVLDGDKKAQNGGAIEANDRSKTGGPVMDSTPVNQRP